MWNVSFSNLEIDNVGHYSFKLHFQIEWYNNFNIDQNPFIKRSNSKYSSVIGEWSSVASKNSVTEIPPM